MWVPESLCKIKYSSGTNRTMTLSCPKRKSKGKIYVVFFLYVSLLMHVLENLFFFSYKIGESFQDIWRDEWVGWETGLQGNRMGNLILQAFDKHLLSLLSFISAAESCVSKINKVKKWVNLGVVVHIWDPVTMGAEARGLYVWGHPELYSMILS